MKHYAQAVERLEEYTEKLADAVNANDVKAADKLIYKLKHIVMAASSEAYTRQVLEEK